MKKIIVMLLIFMTPILIAASENKITDIKISIYFIILKEVFYKK